MRSILIAGSALALLCAAASANANAPRLDPIVITIDAHSYVTYTSPLILTPALHLAQAPEARIANCQRTGGLPPALAPNRLIYALAGSHVEAQTMRIDFHPTRLVLQTAAGDMVCDGVALTGETGVERLFRDYFED